MKVTVMTDVRRHLGFLSLVSLALWMAGPRQTARAQTTSSLSHDIVINEIHYDPDVKTERVEFIELYNTGAASVDLSQWSFAKGVAFTFPAGTSVASHGFVVVAADPSALLVKFGVKSLGPWTGVLSNEGETVILCDAAKRVVDKVDYRKGFPWPTVGDSPGYSIELINPGLDNEVGGNWRASVAATSVQQSQELIPAKSTWKYFKGTKEASSPTTAWRQLGFDDSAWPSGPQPIGYDPTVVMGTSLPDMTGHYTSVFFRKTFVVGDPESVGSLTLEALYDDGFKVWINGTNVLNANISTDEVPYNGTALVAREDNTYNLFTLSNPASFLTAGTNIIAIEAYNISLSSSSDFFLDVRLRTQASQSTTKGPTPGRRNCMFAANAPPAIRQVANSPQQPGSGEAVTITAQVTDPDGVAAVSLSYQVVGPGAYFSKENAAYSDAANWRSVAMTDDGTSGDGVAGDGVYTVVLPGTLQVHRCLVRYRITVSDTRGLSVTAPYADEPQPNFAYFVYDGVPMWRGAIQPGSSDAKRRQSVVYDFGAMPSLPTYHLITTPKAHEESQSIPSSTVAQFWGTGYPWAGTLVYDGVVYDHIHFRSRGGVWRYSMGKNMWKFKFNQGHDFQARDEYGRTLQTTWKKLNLGADIQQGDYGHRGEQGLFEYTGWRLFRLAGCPACITFPVHFRVIENASETNDTPDNQYDDDFQGLYLAVEQVDGRFLDQHGLPDGNLYKMESGTGGGQSNNQGPTQPSDSSDLVSFVSGYGSNPKEQWWRANFDLKAYYAFRAITEGIHNGDIGYGKNYFYYHNPETNLWSIFPWDLDLTWAEGMYGNGNDPFKARILYTNEVYSATREPFNTEFQGRLREVMDLLFNGEQVGQMIDEYAAIVDTPNPGASMVDADRAMWDYNPILASAYVNSGKAGQGRFYQVAASKDFRGMAQIMKDYVTFVYDNTRNWMGDPSNGPSLTDLAMDPVAPDAPTVTSIGPAAYPTDHLKLRSSPYSGTIGVFAAMKWRIAEVTDLTAPAYDPDAPKRYEIEAAWESPELTTFQSDIQIPASVAQAGHAYRVRCRVKDSTGRWSHWSDPLQFVAGAPLLDGPRLPLQITEIMYHPPASLTEDGWDRDDFEFIELMNVGSTSIDLWGVQFVEGIVFDFAAGDVTQLGPGQFVLVVKNRDAFECRYGTAMVSRIAGRYDGKLSDSGEKIKLQDLQTGVVAEFEYRDNWYSSTDGQGRSLVLADPYHVTAGQLGQKESWRASYHWGGSPGAADTQ